jgi:hypothetical protein
LLVAIVRLAPEGVWGLAQESFERLRRRLRGRREVAGAGAAPGSRTA